MTSPNNPPANEVFVSALTLHQSALRGYCQASLGEVRFGLIDGERLGLVEIGEKVRQAGQHSAGSSPTQPFRIRQQPAEERLRETPQFGQSRAARLGQIASVTNQFVEANASPWTRAKVEDAADAVWIVGGNPDCAG
ncbi:MAG: hypothetical protein N2C14_19450, partial [Planctomycetales bacterium]